VEPTFVKIAALNAFGDTTPPHREHAVGESYEFG
jgi:hypothetical protein